MAIQTVSAIAGVTDAQKDNEIKPAPLRELDQWEKASALTLLIVGSVLTVGTLLWFGLGHEGGALVSKTVETTGEGATKKVVETDYSDAIVIFAMTIGGACVLAGALYGRLRDITLGNLKIDVVDDADLNAKPDDDEEEAPAE